MRRLKLFSCCLSLVLPLIAVHRVWAGPVLGDGDQDTDVDLADYAAFANCVSLAGSPAPTSCDVFDFVPSLTIDLSDYELLTCGFGGPGASVDAVTAEPPSSPTSGSSATLSGTTAGATLVQVSGGLQTVLIPTVGCDYSGLVLLRPNVVNHLFVTAIFGDGIPSAPFPVTVVQDAQAPSLFVDYPPANAEITTASTDVAGRVSDALSGFDGLRVKVSVNGQPFVPAAVDIGIGTNLTYFLPSVPLDLGTNTITVRAFDGLENAVEKQIVVTRVDIPPGTPVMSVFSGNAQSAPIHGILSQPIQVQILSTKGVPLAGKVVNFGVVRSDGRLAQSAAELLPGTEKLQAFTDAQGIARAYWRLGSDAGRGNNRIEVTSESVVGTTFFCASATAGPATQINIGAGNNQRAEAGAPAPESLNIWVNDSCNPVSGIAVTFTVRQGGGRVDGLDAVTLNTDSSGHAEVAFTLGPLGGNNIVEAGFPGNPNAPAVFNIFGIVRDAKNPTSFSGLVADNAGQPIQGATCALVIGGVTLPFVQSDPDGQFLFDSIPNAGPADLHVAGASATHVGGVSVPLNSFPSLRYSVVVVPNAANSLSTPVLLPKLDPANARLYSTTQDTELTVAGMAGLKMIVKAGSMKIRSAGQFVPAPNGTAMSLNQVHHDDVPMPLPDGAAPPFAWTLQPGGAQFDPPVTIFYPNISGLPAGAIANFLTFNHDSGKFEIIASGHVTEDGTTIVSDPGSGISVAGWGCNCPPYSVTGQCCHCNEPCQTCVVGACIPTGNGTSCGSTCCAAGQSCCDGSCCNADQECCNGSCVAPGQTCCDDGHTCPSDGSCCQSGCCSQGEECCENGCCAAGQQCCGGNCVSAQSICCDNGVECFPEFPLCCGQGCCVSDGVCCDDECQIPGSECCGGGRVCSPPSPRCCGETCCADGVECCNGVCAAPGAHCCDDANFCSGETPLCCVEACCAADGVCCDGTCFPSGSVCCEGGGGCPADNPQCCDAACCAAEAVCCRGECLAGGSTCCQEGNKCTSDAPVCCHGDCCETGGVCCADGCFPEGTDCCAQVACSDPTPQCCGGACCAAEDICCDGTCLGAASGSVCCEGDRICPGNAPQCCGQENCCPVEALCCGDSGQCCPLEATCCGGACCDVDEVCCNESCHPAPGICCSDTTFCSGLDAVCCDGGCAPEGGACCPGGRTCPGNAPQCCGDSNCCPSDATCCGESGLCCSAIQTCCGGGNCCDVDELCCNEACHPAPGTCCPDGTVCSGLDAVCCNGNCCGEGQECCDGACVPTGDCCPKGTQACGDACCPTGEVCCEDACVSPNACCQDGTRFCGDVCCNAGAVCCENTCVSANACCQDGRRFCGDVCCNAGAVCCSGTCTPENQCCRDGRPFCGDLCCDVGGLCCNGQCLSPGQPCP